MQWKRLPALLSFCLCVFFTATTRAQSDEYHWQSFAPADDDVTAEIPVDLKAKGQSGQKFSRSYRGEKDGTYFYIFSDPQNNQPYYASRISGYVSEWGKKLNIKSSKPEHLKFADPFGYWQAISLIRSDNRVYVAQVVSRYENNEAAERFISSFRLKGTPNAPVKPPKSQPPEVLMNPATVTPSKPESVTDVPFVLSNGRGTATGSGGGMGSGSGTIAAAGNAVPGASEASDTKPAPKSVGIKILIKPKASYTDLARFYELSGWVTLRVTFLATGEIGSISVVRRLPFGLTEESIKAARGIRFVPAQRDNTPFTLTRTVQYTFSIY